LDINDKVKTPDALENSVVYEIPRILPILPLRDNVIFPYMIFPVLVGREQSIKAANFALETTKFIFLAAQKKANIEDPKKEDIYLETLSMLAFHFSFC